jgi:hypothetical protein
MIGKEAPMRIEKLSSGHLTIDGVTCDHDVVIDHGKLGNESRSRPKKLREAFAHTPPARAVLIARVRSAALRVGSGQARRPL